MTKPPTSEAAVIYETEKRKRRFQESWKEGRPWLKLQTDGDIQRMMCTYCKEYPDHVGQKCAFVRGCKQMKICEIKHHESLEGHQVALKRHLASTAKRGTTDADRALQMLDKATVKRLTIMFKTVNSLAKHNRPFTDFVWMCNLYESMGFLEKGGPYCNDKSAALFCHAIAEVRCIFNNSNNNDKNEKVLYLSYKIM